MLLKDLHSLLVSLCSLCVDPVSCVYMSYYEVLHHCLVSLMLFSAHMFGLCSYDIDVFSIRPRRYYHNWYRSMDLRGTTADEK